MYNSGMVKKATKKVKSDKTPSILICAVALITLFFNSRIQDPFNAPKMWLLFFLAAWLIGRFASNRNSFKENPLAKKTLIISGMFLLILFVSTVLTDVRITGFLGENQRRTGFLSYVGFVLVLLGGLIFIKLQNLELLGKFSYGAGFLLAFYGTLQISGNDFISWNNPYNAIISTVGNPNFAAAIMAILGVLSFGLALSGSVSITTRAIAGLSSIYLLVLIYLSDALQGLLSFAVGVSTILIVLSFQKNKKLGLFALSASGFIGFVGILGMLQIGPLTDYLYKGSVTVRGYYWRAGLEMFMNDPIFGVGVDRYGAYFKEFRDKQYALNYGFDITSTNAHNVPIQLFATAGVFVGMIYIALIVFIFIRGIKGIRALQGSNQVLFASVFAAWLAYQAQSIVSIDNIGIAVWGWLLGGVVIGVSSQASTTEDSLTNQPKVSANIGSLVSGVLVISTLVLCVTLYRVEYNMFQQRARYNPQIVENRVPFYEYAVKTLDTPLLEPQYKMMTGTYLVSNMYVNEGMEVLQEVYKSDPRNLDNLGILATFSAQLSQFDNAIKYRKEIITLDPWNGKNYLELGRIYKSLGRFEEMESMRQKIDSFAPNTPEAKSANSDLIP
jgi:O-antigen ligase